MALFATVRMTRDPYRRPSGRPAGWMKSLNLLCHNSAAHPLPVRMVGIGTVRHPKYRWQYVYACPHPHCRLREGWIIGYDGKPFRLWRGRHDVRR
jgi:hypothetical protein